MATSLGFGVIILFYWNLYFLIRYGFPTQLGKGVTRTVWKVGNWAIKVPVSLAGYAPRHILRGIIANQSEWNQRKRADVVKPVWTLWYIIQAYPVAKPLSETIAKAWEEQGYSLLIDCGYSAEEAKHTSWMMFNGSYKLVDYDRAWDNPRTRLARLYYWNDKRVYKRSVAGITFDSVIIDEEVSYTPKLYSSFEPRTDHNGDIVFFNFSNPPTFINHTTEEKSRLNPYGNTEATEGDIWNEKEKRMKKSKFGGKMWVCRQCGRRVRTTMERVIPPRCPNRFCTVHGTPMKLTKG